MTQNPPRHLPINATLQNGKFKILKVLGQGGFGITYLAEHKIYGKVALKELFLSSGTVHCSRENTTQQQVIVNFEPTQFESFKRKFIQEVQTLYNLNDIEGVVNVKDYFEENGTVYFFMDYLEGEKLSDYVKKRKPLPEKEALRIVQSLAKTIAKVHKCDILHRDIKPDNVIISNTGAVYLIDFGIARDFVGEIAETHTTTHTPKYSPPEQTSSKAKMGTYSDIYSLGSTAYYIFTGVQPLSIVDRSLGEYIPPNHYIPTLSTTISDTINNSLIFKSQDRIQTAEAFLLSLEGKLLTPDRNIDNTLSSATQSKEDKTIIEKYSNPDHTLIDNKNHLSEKIKVKEATNKIDADHTIIDQKPLIPSFTHTSDVTIIDEEKQPLDNEKTIIDSSLTSPKKTPFDWQPIKEIATNKFVLGAISLAILSIIIAAITLNASDKIVPEPLADLEALKVDIPHPDRFISLVVVDTFGQLLEETKVHFSESGTNIPMDRYGIFYRKVAQEWDAVKNETIHIECKGFLTEALAINDFIHLIENRDTIRLISKLIPTPEKLIENLLNYNWLSTTAPDSLLVFEQQDATMTGNPVGIAKYNNKKALWSSHKTKEGIHLLVEYTTDSTDYKEHFKFKVKAPFEEEQMQLILLEDGREHIYSPRKKKIEKAVVVLRRYILKGKVINHLRQPLRDSKIFIPRINKTVRTNRKGQFYIDLTRHWRRIRNRSFSITKKGFITGTHTIATATNRNNLVLQINPIRAVAAPIIVRCDNLLNTWWKQGKDALYLKSCSGEKTLGGTAIYNEKTGKWKSYQKEDDLFIEVSFPNGRNSRKFLVNSPSNSQKTSLTYRTANSTLQFNKSNKEQIFCENFVNTWKHENTVIKILNCEHRNLGGKLLFNGQEVDYLSSKISNSGSNVIFNFRAGGVTYVFNVLTPLNARTIKLESYRKGAKTYNEKKDRDIYRKN